jgi:citrate lyase gamma subunit
MNPQRTDVLVDAAYGALIFVSVALIVVVERDVGLAFGFGVLIAYFVHVAWKMSQYDPDWMVTAVEETVEKQVEESVEETVGETVDETVEHSVEKTVGETVQKQVGETVEATVEETVEEKVEETVDETVEEKVDETVEEKVNEVEVSPDEGNESGDGDGSDEAETTSEN